MLAENCYGCHSAEAQAKRQTEIRVLRRQPEGLLTGGETGPALVTGKPAESLLLKVLNHEIKGAEMPPKGKLSEAVIADLARWIEMGAPDPRLASAPISKPQHTIDVEAGRNWWAFQPLRRPAVPAVKLTD